MAVHTYVMNSAPWDVRHNFYSRSNESSSVFLSPILSSHDRWCSRNAARAAKRARMLTQSLTSRDWAMIERTVHRDGENESLSIVAIDNGHMYGYGIGILYRRIRGRLSCQSAYRAPLINRRKRGPLSFLTWHGVCGNQPSPAYDNFASAFALLSLPSFFPSFIIHPLLTLSLSLSLVPPFLVFPFF